MRVIPLLLLIALVIIAIGRVLGPDDLASCSVSPSAEAGCQAADAIVAVSGGDTGARTEEAIKLYHNGWAPKLVFSGAAHDDDSPSNAAVMRDIALHRGVPESDILIDEYSRTTQQNAEETVGLLGERSVSSIILVTSAYHQRRASLEFGSRFSGTVRNHPVAEDRQWSQWWWLTPGGWFLALSEIAKVILFYTGLTR